MKKLFLLLIVTYSLFLSGLANSLQLAGIFTNNMVLQQQQPVPIWGTAKAHSKVSVTFLQQTLTTNANENGDWQVELSPLTASYTPVQLIVKQVEAGINENIIIDNVLVGEVWLSSGQSNMRFILAKSLGGQKAIAQSHNSNIRLLDFNNETFYPTEKIFNIKALEDLRPDNYFHNQGWQVSDVKSSANFSAVAYYFALKLQQELDVPIGIMNVAVGGSLTESFVSKKKLAAIASLAKLNGYWLEHIPLWCKERATYNLSAWLEKYPDTLPDHPFKPSFLFTAGIKPLIPYAIKGVLWYQGESNAPIEHFTTGDYVTMGNMVSAYRGEFSLELSKTKLTALISDWRAQWQKNDLPFYLVQLPGLNRPWAPFRQMQAEVVNEVPNTAMAITYDLGAATDVHPKNKKPVALRLAALVLRDNYGKKLVASGPIFSHAQLVNSEIKVFFKKTNVDHSPLMLMDKSAVVKGFEIASTEGDFIAAQAIIEQDYIVVSHPEITVPTMVRYAWFDDPKDKANLGNKSGFPATPFTYVMN
jgi:sialate O-acetylesterase